MGYTRGDILISVQHAAVVYNQKRSIFKQKKFEALKDVSFDIRAGESIGIVGRNGAGKSTLLNLLAGIIKPDRGTVVNKGAKVSLLALQAGFIAELSGYDNIILSGLALGFKKSEIVGKMEKITQFSGLNSHINVPVRTYSTGMRARLGFSIAHMLHPDVLLIDEILGVGDKEFREKSTRAMREKIKSDQTVVLVSHEPRVVKELCDRAVWIENGIVVMEGRAHDVLGAYEGDG